MAFTFTVEDGSGIEEANSYVSVAFADDYFSVDTNFAVIWAALLTADKQARLAWASRVLDQKVLWVGAKAVTDSGLRWPRQGMVDRDGNVIADDVVPIQVQQATLEMVKVLATADLTVSQNVEYLKEIRVDVIELIWQDHAGQSQLPTLINELLYPLGAINTGGTRFARILKS
jgi:hypothetical protein